MRLQNYQSDGGKVPQTHYPKKLKSLQVILIRKEL